MRLRRRSATANRLHSSVANDRGGWPRAYTQERKVSEDCARFLGGGNTGRWRRGDRCRLSFSGYSDTMDEELGPLFGGPRRSCKTTTRRIGAPKIAAHPVWMSATDAEKAAALRVAEAMNAARYKYGMPHTPVGRVRLSPTFGVPVITRLRELCETLDAEKEDPTAILCACASARVAMHARSGTAAVARGDYANATSIFGDEAKWESVLNAGRAWARGDREVFKAGPKDESKAKHKRGIASHGPRR